MLSLLEIYIYIYIYICVIIHNICETINSGKPCKNIYIYIYIYTHIHIYTYTYIHTYTYTYTYTYTCTCTYTYTYTYAYTYTCTCTYTYAYTPAESKTRTYHGRRNSLIRTLKTDGETKSAVDNWFIRGTASALRSWLLTSVTTPICLCKPFSCKACPGTSRTRGALHSWMRTGCRLVHRRLCMLGMPLHIPVQARTKEFLFKPAEEQNQRLTSG